VAARTSQNPGHCHRQINIGRGKQARRGLIENSALISIKVGTLAKQANIQLQTDGDIN